jgi:7,8-dihydropterin-6-yl-methyl-4-(beta-D-ribofuranosyl)aminobenzene 5'-phosphate synthase
MTANTIAPAPVDEVRITTIVDNSFDLLMASTGVARRLPLSERQIARGLPIAEHGFSVLVEARRGDQRASVLFDTGVSPRGILYNLDALEVRTDEVGAIVLSHGHFDHAMGLAGLVGRLGRRLPLVLHPDAYLERKLVLPNGDEIHMPTPLLADFGREGVEVVEEVGPCMLVGEMVLVTGEVARTTDFEHGMPNQWARRGGAWEPDPATHDDQGVVVHLREKGLVIVTGCGHAGIVNVIRHAQAITGVQAVHAVVGGFHLSGTLFEPAIAPTLAALRQIGPRYLVPGHCTGYVAVHQIARTMPDAFVSNSVGTVLTFA